MNTFASAHYRDSETGRYRWAVVETSTRTWYFPKHYGFKAARALAKRLNRECTQ